MIHTHRAEQRYISCSSMIHPANTGELMNAGVEWSSDAARSTIWNTDEAAFSK